ncbi:MAG: hypothetical protein LC753_15160 [Acidobacteria bacterium]|nr:hypothetical protein [Acidobacteriota bacterium]
MDVVQQEHPLAERGQQTVRFAAIQAVSCGPLQSVEHALLVPVSLQTAQEPGAGVRQTLVVEVDRILRREQNSEPECPSLFQEGEQRRLRRRVRDRRKVTRDFVHVNDRAQARGAGLRAHPPDDLIQQQGDEEHTLRVAEVRDRTNGDPWPAVSGVQKAGGFERCAVHPLLEARRRDQSVQFHRERKALAFGEERLEVHDADLRKRRGLDLLDEGTEIDVASVAPRRREERRDKRVLAAPGRGVYARERQQTGRGDTGPLRQVFSVLGAGRRSGERAQNRHRQPRPAPGRVDCEFGGPAEPLDPRAVLVPLGQTAGPGARLLRRVLVWRHVGAARLVFVDPRTKIAGAQPWKRQQKVADVPFRVDRNDGHAVNGRFLDQRQTQTGLSTSGHTDAHGVRDQVARVVQNRLLRRLPGSQIVPSSEIEEPQLLVVLHSRMTSQIEGARRGHGCSVRL